MVYKTYKLPSGLIGVSVDTRDDPRIFRNRFWQKSIAPRPEVCYYEPGHESGKIIAEYPKLGRSGWVVAEHPKPIGNPNLCIRVRSCEGWTEEDVRTLGGISEISAALLIAADFCEHQMADKEVLLLVHAEPSQHDARSAHILWHILPEPVGVGTNILDETESWMKDSRLSILERRHFVGTIGGMLDGQVNFFDIHHSPFGILTPQLASWLYDLFELFDRKFRSTEGLRPDFSISMRIAAEGRFRYGMFLPKLRHLGAWEYAAITDGTSYSVACSWETMHAYLTSDEK